MDLGARADISARAATLLLTLIVVGALALRLPAFHWLAGAATDPDYSFHPDVNRFVIAASDIHAPNPDGYPQGMTTQLYLLHLLLGRFTHAHLLPLLESITFFYMGALVVLTYATARFWHLSRVRALLSAALLALAPLAVVQSNFGTADITAVAFFYATLLAGGQYLRTRGQLWFVLLSVLTGMAIAVKLFLPLFAPLLLVLCTQRRGERLAHILAAPLIAAGGFEALSLFSYSPWDLHRLFLVLRQDNGFIAAVASGPMSQLRRYGWDLVSAVGIPVALAALLGLVRSLPALRARATALVHRLRTPDPGSLVTPAALFAAAFAAHAFLILTSGVHFPRHLLVFLPAICIAAGQALPELPLVAQLPAGARGALIAGILIFQTYDSHAIETLYASDIRAELADWATQESARGGHVIDLEDWLEVRGASFSPHMDPLQLDADTYVVTCDTEYLRFLGHHSPAEVFHASSVTHGIEFFNAVYDGSSELGIVHEFVSQPRGVELRLVAAGVLAPLGTYVPRRCYALGPRGQLPPDAQRAMRAQMLEPEAGW
jgi:hypothetical protein